MTSQKHLVLDDDVHEILIQRKELTRSSIKEIGNSVLRASLNGVFLSDIIGRVLIDKKLVSAEDFDRVLQEAIVKLQEKQATIKVPIETTKRGTIVSGSLETRQLFRRFDNAFQVLESWTKDPRCLPMETHRHTADEYFIVIQGRVQVTMEGVPYTICPLNVLQVPANVVHSVRPLDADCHMLVILVPAVPEYFSSKRH